MYNDTETVQGWFHGLCLPENPGGYACGGWVIRKHRAVALDRDFEAKAYYSDGPQVTNHIAEYRTLLDCLYWLRAVHCEAPVILRTDSRLVVHQFMRRWQTESSVLRVLLDQAHGIASDLRGVTLELIPAQENHQAVGLAREAYEDTMQVVAGVVTHPREED